MKRRRSTLSIIIKQSRVFVCSVKLGTSRQVLDVPSWYIVVSDVVQQSRPAHYADVAVDTLNPRRCLVVITLEPCRAISGQAGLLDDRDTLRSTSWSRRSCDLDVADLSSTYVRRTTTTLPQPSQSPSKGSVTSWPVMPRWLHVGLANEGRAL